MRSSSMASQVPVTIASAARVGAIVAPSWASPARCRRARIRAAGTRSATSARSKRRTPSGADRRQAVSTGCSAPGRAASATTSRVTERRRQPTPSVVVRSSRRPRLTSMPIAVAATRGAPPDSHAAS